VVGGRGWGSGNVGEVEGRASGHGVYMIDEE
jgi:hypothetical protein